MNTPKAIIIAAGILAIAILISTRFDRTVGDATYFVVHDRWTGRLTRCYEIDEKTQMANGRFRPSSSLAVRG